MMHRQRLDLRKEFEETSKVPPADVADTTENCSQAPGMLQQQGIQELCNASPDTIKYATEFNALQRS